MIELYISLQYITWSKKSYNSCIRCKSLNRLVPDFIIAKYLISKIIKFLYIPDMC